MKPHRVKSILKSLRASRGISRGGGLMLSAVAAWSHIPRATTYRYLVALSDQGLVIWSLKDYRGDKAHLFFISDQGLKLLEDLGE